MRFKRKQYGLSTNEPERDRSCDYLVFALEHVVVLVLGVRVPGLVRQHEAGLRGGGLTVSAWGSREAQVRTRHSTDWRLGNTTAQLLCIFTWVTMLNPICMLIAYATR